MVKRTEGLCCFGLAFLVSTFGPERVLLGSDYPFDMGSEYITGTVLAVDGGWTAYGYV